ncbi:hypothetical protein DOY81_000970 [Sarcophaga bullata]|nr:hypothetical protein DOY81_000970 [Sarcophaga bullata]
MSRISERDDEILTITLITILEDYMKTLKVTTNLTDLQHNTLMNSHVKFAFLCREANKQSL